MQRSTALALVAEADDLHDMTAFIQPRQLARQVFDVHTRPAIDVRWKLVGENPNSHEASILLQEGSL
jgi:hypothetical protein